MGTPVSQVVEFDPSRVRPLPNQPHEKLYDIPELAESIRTVGQISAGLVMLVDNHPLYDAYLINGERRLEACKLAERPFRAEVHPRKNLSDLELYVLSFGANYGAQQHNAIETMRGLKRMMDGGMTIAEMAALSAKCQGWVSQHLSLAKLAPEVQAMMIPPRQSALQGEGGGNAPLAEKRHSAKQKTARTHLTFSLGLMLVSFSRDVQIQKATKIVREGMSLAAARRMILQEVQHGQEDCIERRERQGPRRRMETLRSVLFDFSDRVGVYDDMPADELDRLIGAVGDDVKGDIIDLIELTSGYLERLADNIQSRLTRASGKRPVAGIAK